MATKINPHSFYLLSTSNSVFCNTCNGVKPNEGIHKTARQINLDDCELKNEMIKIYKELEPSSNPKEVSR